MPGAERSISKRSRRSANRSVLRASASARSKMKRSENSRPRCERIEAPGAEILEMERGSLSRRLHRRFVRALPERSTLGLSARGHPPNAPFARGERARSRAFSFDRAHQKHAARNRPASAFSRVVSSPQVREGGLPRLRHVLNRIVNRSGGDDLELTTAHTHCPAGGTCD